MVTKLLIQTIAIGTQTNPLGVLGMKTIILSGDPGILEIKRICQSFNYYCLDSKWGKKSNWNFGSDDANQNTTWRSNSNWKTTNASSNDGVNDSSNENSDGVSGENQRGGYQGRGSLNIGGFRGRGFQGRGECDGFGSTI